MHCNTIKNKYNSIFILYCSELSSNTNSSKTSDQSSGQGNSQMLTWSNGDKYQGKIVNNKLDGLGKYSWATGESLEGNYTNGRKNGFDSMLIKKFSATGIELFIKTIAGTARPKYTFIDSQDNIYIVGNFVQQIDFDPNIGVVNLGFSNFTSINFAFLAKYSASGNLVFSKLIGGNPNSVSVDSNNAVYITGNFSNWADFDPSPTVTNTQTSFDGYSMFITKLTNLGDFVWNKVIGKTTASTSGFGFVDGWFILNDTNNDIIITGSFTDDVDFDTSSGVTAYNSGGSYHTANPFTLKLMQNGDFIWAKYFHSNQDSVPKGLVIDSQGTIYTTGVLQGFMDFDSSDQTLYLNHTYQLVPFIAKMDTSGTILWAKKNFSTDYDVQLNRIKLDDAGNIYTLGTFKNTINYTTASGSRTATVLGVFNQNQNAFVSILNTSGNLVSFNHLGGTTLTFANDLIIKNNNLYLTGNFSETVDFDVSSSVQNLTSLGQKDNFILKYSNSTLQNNIKTNPIKLVIFPNPTTNNLTIKLPNGLPKGQLKIISVTGQTIFETNNDLMSEFTLDVSYLSQGTLIVKILDGSTLYNSKFIKE
jgi:hypothetical protein